MLKLVVIGNVGRDAELKNFNGRQVINFTIASNRYTINPETGEEIEKTTWISCAKWVPGNVNVELHKYLTKGTKVYLEGIPEIKLYKDSLRKTNASLNLNISHLELLSAGNKVDENEPEDQEPLDPQQELEKDDNSSNN